MRVLGSLADGIDRDVLAADLAKLEPLPGAPKPLPQLAPHLKQPINFGLPKDGIKFGTVNIQSMAARVDIKKLPSVNDVNGDEDDPGE